MYVLVVLCETFTENAPTTQIIVPEKFTESEGMVARYVYVCTYKIIVL